jgi:hypothetical protein
VATSPPRPRARARSAWSPAALALVALMAVGSAIMWIGLPIGLVYLASKVADSAQPSLGPYLIVIFGLPIGMTIVGKALGVLDRAYGRLTDTLDEGPRQAPWMRSMRGERGSTRKNTVLDAVMVWSVASCLVLLAIWFFAFAGSSLPGA